MLKPNLRRAAPAMAAIVTLMLIANQAHSQFTLEIAANLPPVSPGSAAPGLPGLYDSSVAWGDFDNDNHPDFLITGITNGFSNVAISQLWRNTGNGFTNVPIPGLAGVFVSSVAWADYDNDGFLDFLLQGNFGQRLYHPALEKHRQRCRAGANIASDGGGVGMRRARGHNDAIQLRNDPFGVSLPDYAWQSLTIPRDYGGRLTVHPVGQKLPTTYGNVFEWCRSRAEL